METPVYNTRLRSRRNPEVVPDQISEVLNTTLRDDDSFVSTLSLEVSPAKNRKSLSHGDLFNVSQALIENEVLKSQVLQLQRDNLEMQNAVIRKDEIIVKQECEIAELKRELILSKSSEPMHEEELNEEILATSCLQEAESINFDDPEDLFYDFDEFLNNKTNDYLCSPSQSIEKNKILILSDSHGRSLSDKFTHELRQNNKLQVIFKPNGQFNNVIDNILDHTRNFTSSDHLIVIAGTNNTHCKKHGNSNFNNIDFNNLKMLRNKTNVHIFHVFKRFDCTDCNSNVELFNNILNKNCSEWSNMINLSNVLHRRDFTKHGLHLNVHGKRKIAKVVTNLIESPKPIKSSFLCCREFKVMKI